jgi:hypothetical protein
LLNKTEGLTFLRWIYYGSGFKKVSEYEVHQVGPTDPGSQNFSFLALKAELEVKCKFCIRQRQRRNFFDCLNHVIYSKEVLKNENQLKFFFSFFSTPFAKKNSKKKIVCNLQTTPSNSNSFSPFISVFKGKTFSEN